MMPCRNHPVGLSIAFTSFVLATAAVALGGCQKQESARETETAKIETAADIPVDAPAVVADMIAAHGGLDAWRVAPAVSFEDEFAAPGSPASVSRVSVEQGSRRAHIEYPGANASAMWDGTNCWSRNWSFPFPPRFIVLLNYYFLNLPWLTMDPGVKLAESGTAKILADPTEYVTVMMTFEAGTGDTPDDYYRLYIDPATKRLKACDYIVTYRALLPEGVASTPEHLLVFEEHQTVGGLVVPVKYTIYEAGRVYATCAVRDWSFERPFDAAAMIPGEGAVMDTSTP
jgi:hypothetical protein